MDLAAGDWHKGPLTITYAVHPDGIRIDSFLYQVKIGYANLNPSQTCVRKTAKAELAHVDMSLRAEFVEKYLTCKGKVTTYCIEKHEWKDEEFDEKIAKW
ncbi:MAG: hypothetical protein ACI9S8_000811 [Chlamydiales bacterium]|jgi:hypothetical protein